MPLHFSASLGEANIAALAAFFLGAGIATLFFLVKTDRKAGVATTTATTTASEPTPRASEVNRELQIISSMIRRYMSKNHAYASQLTAMNERLAKPLGPTEIREIVGLLIDDNNKLIQSTNNLGQRLEESQEKIQKLTVDLDSARKAGDQDALTSLYSRSYFDEAFDRLVKAAARAERPLCLMLIDVDNFKPINDTYGHLVGNEVLKKIGALIQGSVRRDDIAARYGGDEFAIILPGASVAEAKLVAERMQSLLEQKKWTVNNAAVSGLITISVGVASLSPQESPETLFERADANLYKSKSSGKSRITIL
ncbi:MAG TPA: GGDEF domain-containing protein [Methylocystis sp.]|nr:GGDEF domain-containing protein [Methylocystis sp.]